MATKGISAAGQQGRSPVSRSSPFRATKLWNQLLSSFKEGMELKRKRWRLRSYDQCFSGADAMQWLYSYLQNHPSFGAHVTREQTFMLLQKFLENNVFQGVVVKNCTKFQDTNHLYRFADDVEKMKNKTKEVITTKEDKENFNSGNSLSNLMRTISRRNSKLLDINPPETHSHQLLQVDDAGATHSSGFTPLSKNMNDMSILGNKQTSDNYSDFSTLLFEADEADEVFETSISNTFFTRSNSLQMCKRETPPRNPLGTLWINEYNKSESQYADNMNNEKNNERKKMPRNFGKASLHNLKRRTLRKRKSGDVSANKFSTKLAEVTEEKETSCKRRRSCKSLESISSGSNASSVVTVSCTSFESIGTMSKDGSCTGSQISIPHSLPSKALAILGEDLSQVERYRTFQINKMNANSRIHGKHKLSPKSKSDEALNYDAQNNVGKCVKGMKYSISDNSRKDIKENSRKLSFCNVLHEVNRDSLPTQESNSVASHTSASDETGALDIRGTIKKAASSISIGPSFAEKSEKTRKPARRTHAMLHRSISQNSLKWRNCGSRKISSDIEEHGYPFNYSTESLEKNRLYKVPSSWSIDTIGLMNESEGKEGIPEITVDDVEETWKTVLLLSLKKMLRIDSIKELFDISQINGASIMKNVSWNPSEITQDAPGWLLSAMNCLVDWPNISKDAEDSILLDLPNYPGFERDVYKAVKEHYHTTLSKPLIPEYLYPLVQECADALAVNKDKGIRIMQHIILLLPCWNRRQLQLLIDFMNKVSSNDLLEMSKDLPNRDLVIHSFMQLIVRRGKQAFTLEAAIKPMRITNMLIDSYDLVFKAPPNLRGQVDHKLAILLQKPSTAEETSIPENVSALGQDLKSGPHFYCQQITKVAYEKEAKENYHKAINDLLTAYITDPSFTEKERKKRLKQFQKAYPEIYAERSSCDDVSNCSTISEFSTNFKHAVKPSFLSEKII